MRLLGLILCLNHVNTHRGSLTPHSPAILSSFPKQTLAQGIFRKRHLISATFYLLLFFASLAVLDEF